MLHRFAGRTRRVRRALSLATECFNSLLGGGTDSTGKEKQCWHEKNRILIARIILKLIIARYGFAIGNVAAFDMDNPDAVVSPGGVGFDINCGVRLIRTNLMEKDVKPVKESLAQALFDHIPVGVGSLGIIPIKEKDLEVRWAALFKNHLHH